MINGREMFLRVYDAAKNSSRLDSITVAFDDDRIGRVCFDEGISNRKTLDCPTGSDRIASIAESITTSGSLFEDDILIDLQCDEPMLVPEMIDDVLTVFRNPHVLVGTLVRKVAPDEVMGRNYVKVAVSRGVGVYFSRDIRSEWLSIGLHAYKWEALKRFHEWGRGELEVLEDIEQLRFLEMGIPVYVAETKHVTIGVDRPEDIARVEERLKCSTS